MFEKVTLNVIYRVGNRRRTVNLRDGGNADVGFAITKDSDRLKIELITDGTVTLDEAFLTTDYYYVPHYNVYCGALAEGFSMETPVSIGGKRRLLRYINSASPVKIRLNPLRSYGYTYIRDRENYTLVGSLDEEPSFTEINHRPELKRMTFKRSFGGLLIPEEYRVFDLYFSQGSYDAVFDGYFERLLKDYRPGKILKEYSATSSKLVPLDSKRLHEKLTYARDFATPFDLFCIESYEKSVGEWLLTDPARFTETLEDIAVFINNVGMQAGIKLSPFRVSPDSPLAEEHKRFLEKDDFGMLVKRKGCYHYDIDNVEAQEYVKSMFSILKSWGYTVFKIDGISDLISGKTPSRKAYKVMRFLRECVGEDATFIALDSPVLVAAGIADYCRITGNTVRIWKGKLFSRFFNKKNSARNLVLNAVSRRHLDGRAFRNYPATMHFDESNVHLKEEQKLILFIVNKFFSGAVTVSDDLRLYTDSLKAMFASLSEGTDKEKIVRIVFPYKKHIRIEYLDDEGEKRMFCFDLRQGKILYTI